MNREHLPQQKRKDPHDDHTARVTDAPAKSRPPRGRFALERQRCHRCQMVRTTQHMDGPREQTGQD